MAAPKGNDNARKKTRRTTYMQIKCTVKEKTLIELAAKSEDSTVSDFVRNKIGLGESEE